jgi:hypothetical protein
MKGDFSRDTFRSKRRYSAVLMQQGRVQLDADWNEQGAIDRYRTETEATDVIGACGAPEHAPGFAITSDGDNLLIGAGRYYVDGLLCENDDDQLPYDQQDDLPGALPDDVRKALEQADTPFGIAYLDVWQHHITALDDLLLRETGLGGPDTTTRIKTVWQVKVLPVTQQSQDTERLNALLAEQKDLQAKLDQLQQTETKIQSEIDKVQQELTQITNRTQAAKLQTLLKSFQSQQAANQQAIAEAKAKLGELKTAIDALPKGAPPTCASSFAEWDALAADSGTLNARTQPADQQDDPCLLPPSAGYQRLENQLYRVEVHEPGALGAATFKWSRDNGAVVTTIEKISGNVLTVHDLGPDEVLGFANGQWVEIADDVLELNGRPGQLAQIDTINTATREITLLNVTPQPLADTPSGVDSALHPKLRRWDQADQSSAPANEHGVAAAAGWLPLEGGISVQFSDGAYRTGDYWLIPARTATAEIEWPPYATPNTDPIAQAPLGIRHHRCRLALLQLNDGALSILDDCRQIFPPLTELLPPTALHVVATNWQNDDLFNSQQFLQSGLRITLDAPPDALAVGTASVIVTAELPYRPTGSDTQSVAQFNQSLILNGTVGIDSADPRVIIWQLTQASTQTLRSAINAGATSAPATKARAGRTARIARPAVSAASAAPTNAIRVRVTLKGPVIWGDADQKRLYLDGQAFGQPGTRAADKTPCSALAFPTGSSARASDFESWFYIGGDQRQTALQVNHIRFVSVTAAAGERVIADVDMPTNQQLTFSAGNQINAIDITFSRAVQADGFNPSGKPQSVRLAFLSGDQEKGRASGDLSLNGNVARFLLRDPSTLNINRWRLTVLGSDVANQGPGVRAADNGTPLDGNFDGQTGDDLVLNFGVNQ